MSNLKQMLELIYKVSQYNEDLEKYMDIVEKATSKKSEYLVGVIGGIIGLLGEYGVSVLFDKIVFNGPIGFMFGVAVSIMLWRGKKQHKIERLNKENDTAKTYIKEDISSRLADAPQSTVNKLWRNYNRISDIYKDEIDKLY